MRKIVIRDHYDTILVLAAALTVNVYVTLTRRKSNCPSCISDDYENHYETMTGDALETATYITACGLMTPINLIPTPGVQLQCSAGVWSWRQTPLESGFWPRVGVFHLKEIPTPGPVFHLDFCVILLQSI